METHSISEKYLKHRYQLMRLNVRIKKKSVHAVLKTKCIAKTPAKRKPPKLLPILIISLQIKTPWSVHSFGSSLDQLSKR